MKKIIGVLLLAVMFVGCNNSNKNINSNKTTQNEAPQKVGLKEELPAPQICKSDIGVLKMNDWGYSKGTRTELTELKKYLNKKNCDIIEITYELKGSYGSNIKKKLTFNKRDETLEDIFTRTNVINDYSNVHIEGLKKFLNSGEKDIHLITKYSKVKYDYNTSEMKQTAVGTKPEQSEWDGSVKLVEKYIKTKAHDAASIEFIEWSKVTAYGKYWIVRCKYKGNNAIGTMVTSNSWFYIQNEKVMKVKEI